jgi:hypothetical protein
MRCHWHRIAFNNRSYLGELEAEFKKALARESGAQGILFDEKRTKISRHCPFKNKVHIVLTLVCRACFRRPHDRWPWGPWPAALSSQRCSSSPPWKKETLARVNEREPLSTLSLSHTWWVLRGSCLFPPVPRSTAAPFCLSAPEISTKKCIKKIFAF